jgi:1-acyl-sn-glycerol-3-phosphate acyltransferase
VAPGISRWLTRLARVVLAAYFRQVVVKDRANVPGRGPVLVVANHVNGFVDPIVVVHTLGLVPRFVAKATLWKLAPVRPLLAALGVLPVARRQDRELAKDGNADTFTAIHRALADGGTVAIFPEGTAHDEPHLLPFRTGAARMALGARAEGARNLQIVPVGITFDDKLALRSRALATVGTPLDLDRWVAARPEPTLDDTDRDTVRDLTGELARRLGALTPQFSTADEAGELRRAAEIAVRTATPGDGEVPLHRITDLAGVLSAATPARREAVRAQLNAYQRALDVVGLDDDALVSDASPRRLAVEGAAVMARSAALAPLAVVGTAVNALPYAVVRSVGLLARKPAAMGTLRVLAGLVLFPLAWLLTGVAVGRRKGAVAGLAAAGLAALGGAATVVEFERMARLRRAWRGAERRWGVRGRVAELLDARAALLAAVEDATGPPQR